MDDLFSIDSNLKLGLVFLALIFLWFLGRGYLAPTAQYGQFIENPARIGGSTGSVSGGGAYTGYAARVTGSGGGNNYASGFFGNTGAVSADYQGQFSIDQGTASFEYRPGDEYIVLHYWGEAPVDITGWYFTNANGSRLYQEGQERVYGEQGVAVIPQVANLLTLGRSGPARGDLVLQSGDTVVVTTGSLPANAGELAGAEGGFRLNRCVGYLQDSGDYDFAPSLWGSCPAPRDWPAAKGLDERCYNFVSERIGSCHAPEFKTNRYDDSPTVDGAPDTLTGLCRNFIKQTYNYSNCVATFANTADFYQPEWRVFLGRRWEFWGDKRETISLYDRNHRLVTQTSY